MTEQQILIVVSTVIVLCVRVILYARMTPDERRESEKEAMDSMSLFPRV
jgi:hypothetical protein